MYIFALRISQCFLFHSYIRDYHGCVAMDYKSGSFYFIWEQRLTHGRFKYSSLLIFNKEIFGWWIWQVTSCYHTGSHHYQSYRSLLRISRSSEQKLVNLLTSLSRISVCLWIIIKTGLRREECPSKASEFDPGSSRDRKDRYVCGDCLPSCEAGAGPGNSVTEFSCLLSNHLTLHFLSFRIWRRIFVIIPFYCMWYDCHTEMMYQLFFSLALHVTYTATPSFLSLK